jgi:DNA-binding NarL/FixJ family response regulator
VLGVQAAEDGFGVLMGDVGGLATHRIRPYPRHSRRRGTEGLDNDDRSHGTDWAAGIEAQCRALLSDGDTAEELYGEAITKLQRSRVRLALARAHLLYGEWLRRDRRNLAARNQLRTAHEMLTDMGIHAFAERAARELRATGAIVRKPTAESNGDLTPQETQIARLARLAREGLSNNEIGSRLFLSPRTVEYHLRKVFAKLRINSRKELISVLGSQGGLS